MFRKKNFIGLALLISAWAIDGCHAPAMMQETSSKPVPAFFGDSRDNTNMAETNWRSYFNDSYLANLVDTALANNQELLITLQEIEQARNDIRFRHAALMPTVGIRGAIGVDKVGRYTSQGAGDASTEITKGKEVPEALMDYTAQAYAHWEVDVWHKLHNAKKAAAERYLSTVEGKNFVVTNLVAEVANSYYELLALDNQLEIVRQNITLQKNALEIVKVQKEAARVTELAVQKFRAEVLHSQSLEYNLVQNIQETENKINFLLARYPQPIARDRATFFNLMPAKVQAGIPAQLLANRPDIKQAELSLQAAKLDVKVARAEFYPSLDISAALGFQAFKPSYLLKFPESMLYSLAADLAGPIINRNAIQAEFKNANSRQLQALYNYDRSVLNAYFEVATQISKIDNLAKSYDLKVQQVDALSRSINISNDLFKNARADYLEVLMTQRDALEAKLELVETKQQQLSAMVNVYRGLGGGWR